MALAIAMASAMAVACAGQNEKTYMATKDVPFEIVLDRASGTGTRWFSKNSGPFEIASPLSGDAQQPGGAVGETYRITPLAVGTFTIDWELRRPGGKALASRRTVIVVKEPVK